MLSMRMGKSSVFDPRRRRALAQIQNTNYKFRHYAGVWRLFSAASDRNSGAAILLRAITSGCNTTTPHSQCFSPAIRIFVASRPRPFSCFSWIFCRFCNSDDGDILQNLQLNVGPACQTFTNYSRCYSPCNFTWPLDFHSCNRDPAQCGNARIPGLSDACERAMLPLQQQRRP